MTTDELVAILAGSLVGLIVFLAILAIIIYCLMGRRKKKKEQVARKQNIKHFPHHQLPPKQDSNQSKQSSLSRVSPGYADPRYDYRLPKVGSNPLWFGTPSVYGVRPPQHGYGMRHGESTSTGYVHPVYQGSHKIYHSQQVGYPPVYDPAYGLPRSGSHLDGYPYAYGYDRKGESYNSRAMLLEYPENLEYMDPYLERERRRTGKKVRRSQSDATMHSTRRPKNKRHRNQSPNNPSRGGTNQVNAEVHVSMSKTKAAGPPLPPLTHTKKPSEEQTKTLNILDPDLPPSATDSAKLRAIEKAREREPVEHSGGESSMNDLNVRHYNYSGNIASSSSPSVLIVPKIEPNSRQRSMKSDLIDFPPPVDNALNDGVPKSVSDTQENTDVDMMDGAPPRSPANYIRKARRTVSSGSAIGGDTTDIAKEAKEITSDAFGFLEEYSDDEGMDLHGSGQTSPVFNH